MTEKKEQPKYELSHYLKESSSSLEANKEVVEEIKASAPSAISAKKLFKWIREHRKE